MKSFLGVAALYIISGLLVFYRSFQVFFTQDDFILTWEYSHGSFLNNFLNLFKYPSVSHFRPLDDLYYLISGTIFDKNYLYYHLLTFLVLLVSSLLVYLVVKIITKSAKAGFIAGLLFMVSAIHFLTLYWISGNAVLLGFLFFILSFYFLLKNKFAVSIITLFIGFLGSETFIFGSVIFAAYVFLYHVKKAKFYVCTVIAASVAWGIIRYLFFTPPVTFDQYHISLGIGFLQTGKYYLARLLGLSESSGDFILSVFILILQLGFLCLVLLDVYQRKKLREYALALIIVVVGLFPFIFIPNHLAANYMTLSIFGVCLAIALCLRRLPIPLLIVTLTIWIILQSISVSATASNSWVTKSATLSKTYINLIEKRNVEKGSTIIFTGKSDKSREVYIALGGGRAIDFWFKGENFKTCFEFFQNCNSGLGKTYKIDPI